MGSRARGAYGGRVGRGGRRARRSLGGKDAGEGASTEDLSQYPKAAGDGLRGMSGLVYDAGALVAADRNNRRMWALHRRALERGIVPQVPATVLIQTWRSSRQAHLGSSAQGFGHRGGGGVAGSTGRAVSGTVGERRCGRRQRGGARCRRAKCCGDQRSARHRGDLSRQWHPRGDPRHLGGWNSSLGSLESGAHASVAPQRKWFVIGLLGDRVVGGQGRGLYRTFIARPLTSGVVAESEKPCICRSYWFVGVRRSPRKTA